MLRVLFFLVLIYSFALIAIVFFPRWISFGFIWVFFTLAAAQYMKDTSNAVDYKISLSVERWQKLLIDYQILFAFICLFYTFSCLFRFFFFVRTSHPLIRSHFVLPLFVCVLAKTLPQSILLFICIFYTILSVARIACDKQPILFSVRFKFFSRLLSGTYLFSIL